MAGARRDANAGSGSQLSYSLLSLNEACRLRQKARESWDYFITNEVVYEAKGSEGHPFAGEGYLEQYLASKIWFEVVFSPLGHSYTARAILESFNRSAGTREHGYELAARDFDVESMLVGIPEPIENRERMIIGISSVCWLKVCDVRDRVRQDIHCRVPEVGNASVRKVSDQRKGRVIGGLTVRVGEVAEGKIPSNVVQGRTKVMDDIAEDGAKGDRGRTIRRDVIDHVVEVLRIEVSSESLRVSIKEDPRLPFEFVKVFARPFNLESRACDVAAHEVESTYGQDAEDSEGPRNPRARTRRVRSRSQQHSQDEALNSLSPEKAGLQPVGTEL